MAPPPRPRTFAQLWFPVSLIILLILALPGVILLALNLFGLESRVNAWLQDNLNLSYHLPIPWWAAILLLFIPLVLILLYFLKLKRKPLQVPSTFLWRKSIDDLHVNSLFQWLRDNVLLLVQLLTLLLLIYSILSLQVHGQSDTGKHYILMIDNSASMAVKDMDGQTRLEAAKEAALREIKARPGDTGMVIVFNSRAATLQPYTRDQQLLNTAVERITQTQQPTRLEEALDLARSLANPLRSTEDQATQPTQEIEPGKRRTQVAVEGIAATVHLFSDGRFSDGTTLSSGSALDPNSFTRGQLALNYHRMGLPGSVHNVGLVTLTADRDVKDRRTVLTFARMLNFGPDPITVTLEMDWREMGRDAFHVKETVVKIPARVRTVDDAGKVTKDEPGEGKATFELTDIGDSTQLLIEARLKDVDDQFPLDDRAWLVFGLVRKARVLIVTPGNKILRHFFDLEATQKVAKVTYLEPDDLKDDDKYIRPARVKAWDLVIFDRCAPGPGHMPQANTYFIDSVPSKWKRSEMKPLNNVTIQNPTSNHPLMRYLRNLDWIAFSQAFYFDLKREGIPPRVPKLLEVSDERAVLFVLPRGNFRDLVQTFPLVTGTETPATNWPVKLSFPIFLRNVLYELGEVQEDADNTQPGAVKILDPDVPVESVEVVTPEGTQVTVKRSSEYKFPFKDTNQVGIYRASWEGGNQSFAVNLFDPMESDIRPDEVIELGGESLITQQTRPRTYDIWKWVALAALILLIIEWALYHRRLFI